MSHAENRARVVAEMVGIITSLAKPSAEVVGRLERWTDAQWRNLAAATGRPNYTPSADTRRAVIATVRYQAGENDDPFAGVTEADARAAGAFAR